MWPHTVDSDPWEYCFQVFAYDAVGKAVTLPLTMDTRQVKMIEMAG